MTDVKIISRDELKALIESDERYHLIDFREKEETSFGMIPTSFNIPPSEFVEAFKLSSEDFARRYGFLKPKKDEKIVVYCRTGGRSSFAARYLVELGFTNVFNYSGSILDWSAIDPNVRMY